VVSFVSVLFGVSVSDELLHPAAINNKVIVHAPVNDFK
jgi:hypothetical protein